MCARVFIFLFVCFCLHDQLNKSHFENEIVKNSIRVRRLEGSNSRKDFPNNGPVSSFVRDDFFVYPTNPVSEGYDFRAVSVITKTNQNFTFAVSRLGLDWLLRRDNLTNTWVAIEVLREERLERKHTGEKYAFSNTTAHKFCYGPDDENFLRLPDWESYLLSDEFYNN